MKPVRRAEGFDWEDVERLAYKPEGEKFRDVSRQLLFGPETGLRAELRYFEVAPGGHSTLEKHEHVHAVVILRGRGRVLVGDRVWDVEPRDLVHVLERDRSSGFVVRRFYARDANGQPTLPSVLPEWRLQQQYEIMGPAAFARAYELQVRDDEGATFDKDDLKTSFSQGYELVLQLDHRPDDQPTLVVAGIDPATRKKETANFTAISVVIHYLVDNVSQLLWIESGHLLSREIAGRVFDLEGRFAPDIFVAENNAAQAWLEEILQLEAENRRLRAALAGLDPAVPDPTVMPYHTGRQKADPVAGISGLSVEISTGRWVFPDLEDGGNARQQDVRALWEGMMFYTPRAHTSDHLMSLWLAREGIRALVRLRWNERRRRSQGRPPAGGVRVVGEERPSALLRNSGRLSQWAMRSR